MQSIRIYFLLILVSCSWVKSDKDLALKKAKENIVIVYGDDAIKGREFTIKENLGVWVVESLPNCEVAEICKDQIIRVEVSTASGSVIKTQYGEENRVHIIDKQ